MPTEVENNNALVFKEDINKNEEVVVFEVSENNIKDKIYTIRGQQVMLDSDLAKIYGYTTKRFNQQVKNNIKKFDDDFMFVLTSEEWNNLRSKNLTSSLESEYGGRRYLPKVFTEQGIYMLMTILKGDLATLQSKALIRTFKQMKDYIIDTQPLLEKRNDIQQSLQISQNTQEINNIKSEINSINEKVSNIVEKVDETVKKSDLADMINNFISNDNGYLIYNDEFCSADAIYTSIYQKAKSIIYVVDNYIGVRTLIHLKNANPSVKIIVFSDNIRNLLSKLEYDNFHNQFNVDIEFKETCGKYHDRFIAIDYNTPDMKVFHCGASSKDAGVRITSIVEDYGIEKYIPIIADLLKNPTLILI